MEFVERQDILTIEALFNLFDELFIEPNNNTLEPPGLREPAG